MYVADLDTETPFAHGPHVRAIGWLDAAHPFTRGPVAADVRAHLGRFAALWTQSTVELRWRVATSPHTCTLCNAYTACGTFGVPGADVVYVVPTMITHYVDIHAYQPPAEFREALMFSPRPGTVEYEAICAPYRRKLRDPWD